MSGAASQAGANPPAYPQIMGHPGPLWMLFMSEFWERFAFYGIRWALVLYIVAQFYNGDPSGQQPAGLIYGSYLALVYAGAIFGGLVADRYIGYQRSILIGAVIMALGLFLISIPNQDVFKLGLATIVVGNGLFKPIISTVVGKIYAAGDERRDSGFTIFYMGINAGAFIAPILTQILAEKVFGTEAMPAYKVVFIASAIGMVVSTFWFWLGRGQLKGVGEPPTGGEGMGRVTAVIAGSLAVIPVVYFLLALGAEKLQIILTIMFVGLAIMLLVEGIKNGPQARDKVIAMLIIFTFNILFWMFFEQAGSSFTFLAEEIVSRNFADAFISLSWLNTANLIASIALGILIAKWIQQGAGTREKIGMALVFVAVITSLVLAGTNIGGWTFPTAWFQSVNSVAIITLAPVIAWIWVKLSKVQPSKDGSRVSKIVIAVVGLAVLTLVARALFQALSQNGAPTWVWISVIATAILSAALVAWSIVIDFKSTTESFNPSIPRKFGLGLLFNGLAFLLLMFALSRFVDPATLKIPFWTLFAVYWIQSIGELCLSPIGLSMVTKLAPLRLVGFGMGGWFLSTGIGNNLSGIFAGHVSGEGGMTTASALSGYTFGFWSLIGFGVLLFLIAPLIQKLMHGVK